MLALISLIFIGGWSPPKGLSVYKNIKAEVTSQVQALFGREVEIGDVKGILINQIELNNVKIAKGKSLKEGAILTAKKIYLNYNPFKLAAHKGDMVPALSKIVIIEPEFSVERKADGTWNMAELLPVKSNDNASSPAFIGTISIKDGKGPYSDPLGFGEDLKGKTFSARFESLNGDVTVLKNGIKISVSTNAIIDKSYSYAKVDGNVTINSGKYYFVVHVKNLDINKWGSYTLNIPNVKPISGFSDMKLIMTNPPKREKGQPILFTGDFNIRNGVAVILNKEVKDIYGFIRVHDEEVTFKNLHGKLFDTALTLNGKFNDFSVANYKIILQTDEFDFKKLGQVFGIEPWKVDFSGKGNIKLFVTGNYARPVYNGRFFISDGSFFGKELKGPGSFYLEGPLLSLKISGLNTLKGKLYAEGLVDLAPAVPTIAFSVTTEASDLRTLTGLKGGISGNANIETRVTGNINYVNIKGRADLLNCDMLSQKFDSATFDVRFLEKDIEVKDLSVSYGNVGISARGTIEGYSNMDLGVECKNISIAGGSNLGNLKASINKFNGRLYGPITSLGSSDPLYNVGITGDIFLSDMEIDKQPFYQGNGLLKLEKRVISLNNFLLQIKQSFLSVNGCFGLGAPVNLKITGNNVELSEVYHLMNLVPKQLQPYDGKADVSLYITGKTSREAPFTQNTLAFSGNVLLKNCRFASESVEEGDIRFSWSENRIIFEDSKIRTPTSNVNFYGLIDSDRSIDMRIKGTLDLSNAKPFTHKYGQIFGEMGIDLSLSGAISSPNVSASFNGTNLRYNKLIVDGISGSIFYNGELLNLIEPLKVHQKNDEYQLSGNVLFKEVKEGKRSYVKPHISLKYEIVRGDLGTLLIFLDTMNSELISRQAQTSSATEGMLLKKQQKDIFDIGNFLEDENIILYSSERKDKKQQSVIHTIDAIGKELKVFEETASDERKINASGNIQGYVSFSGDMDNLNGALSIEVASGSFESYGFDNIELKGKLISGTFEVETAYLKKGKGILNIKGSYNPNTVVSMDINATRMPIDFLSVFIGEDKNIKGSFSMHAEAKGSSKKPNIIVSFESSNPEIAEIKLAAINARLMYSNDLLDIEEIRLIGRNRSETSINGIVPLTGDKQMNVMISIEGDSIGLISLAYPGTTWVRGRGNGEIRVSGNISRPKFNGRMIIEDASISINALKSSFDSVNAGIEIDNNKINVSKLSADWISERTPKKPNQVEMSGTIDIKGLFEDERKIDLDLQFKDSDFVVNIKDLYKGDFSFKDLAIRGQYYSDKSGSGPTVSGKISIGNGEINLPQISEDKAPPPFDLDLELKIGKNTYFTAGEVQDIMSTNFSNVFLNLEVESESLNITGTMRKPNIKGEVNFVRGIVNILNREFTLMSEDRQKELFASDLDKVKKNQAVFYGRGGDEGILPYIYLTSEIKIRAVEEAESTSSAEDKKYKTRDVTVVSRISGIPFVKEKENAITLSFMSFTEDPTKHEIVPGKYSEQEIKVLLLPEFIKRPLGIKEGESMDTNQVIVDYLNSRLNAFLLRGIEREIAKELDLERLTLEYNFGKDLRNLLPAQQKDIEEPLERREMLYGVGFEKGFFDRFFIDVKYSQALEEAGGLNRSLFNYQITYKLNPLMSVLYYREPLSFIEEENNYYKVTLKAGYNF